MIRSFEALFAAILVIGFMFYIVEFPSFQDTNLNYQTISLDKIRTCTISSTGYPLKLVVLRFNQSFDHACVTINVSANYTYVESTEFIPSRGGQNITLQIDRYNGGPILIYITNETTSPEFNCIYPYKTVGYSYVIQPTNARLLCEGTT